MGANMNKALLTIFLNILFSVFSIYNDNTSDFDLYNKINPSPEINILTDDNFPGNILIVQLNNIKDNLEAELSTNLSHGLISSNFYNNSYLYFIPIDIWATEGTYNLTITIRDKASEEMPKVELSENINVTSKNFVEQYLYISEQVYAETNSDAAYKEFREKAQGARSVSDMEKYWEGKFMIPVKDDYVLSTDYGEIRYVNDRITSTRHSGLDLAAPTGTEVFSCNSGKIVLSEYLILTGNTLIIDHGMGIFTSYYHMDTLYSKEGDFVKKGDPVGTVGSTGFSTGPHLHWSISIFNTYVNTWQVVENELL
jgi:murein DD-endopeptidase MepM/ murein hydrolase activator NlpD